MRNAEQIIAAQRDHDEWHIASLVLSTTPQQKESIKKKLRDFPNLEVQPDFEGPTQDHKIILVAEAKSEGALADLLSQLQSLEGVVTANLIFHQSESSDLDEILTIQPQCDASPLQHQ